MRPRERLAKRVVEVRRRVRRRSKSSGASDATSAARGCPSSIDEFVAALSSNSASNTPSASAPSSNARARPIIERLIIERLIIERPARVPDADARAHDARAIVRAIFVPRVRARVASRRVESSRGVASNSFESEYSERHTRARVMRRVRTRARRAPASIVARVFAVAVACVTARTVTASTPVEDECPCLSIHDPRFSCAPVAHADAMPTETIRRVREAAIERAKTHGWERERPKHDYVDETREVKGRDLPETVRDELRRTFDERLAPLAREQCMIDEKMKFENHEFYVVKYDAVNFPSVAQHVDEKP